MWNLIWLAAAFSAGIFFYAYGQPILAALRRFDERNAARRAEEFAARFDALAHYRQTMRAAEEQVEDVIKVSVPNARTGVPLPRYIFLGVEYATLTEAEAARQSAIVAQARAFYRELDTLWLKGRRSYNTEDAVPSLTGPKPDDSKH